MQSVPAQHAKPARRSTDAGDLNDCFVAEGIPAAEYYMHRIMEPKELLCLYRCAAACNQTRVQLVVLGNPFGECLRGVLEFECVHVSTSAVHLHLFVTGSRNPFPSGDTQGYI